MKRALLMLQYVLAVLVSGYDDQWRLIDTQDTRNITFAWRNIGLPNARYYHIGVHPNILRLKQPFEYQAGGGRFAIPLIHAAAELTRIRQTSVMIEVSDWGFVASGPICSGHLINCTDVMVIGTTQMAGRVAEKILWPVNTFMNDYAAETGQSFTDNFIQQYIYDYFYDGQWMAVPLVSDTRVLYYNKTLFDQLGLKRPPPDGDWGTEYWKTWNWKTWFETVKVIKDAGYPYGFESHGSWDEELKWVTLVAREYNSTMLRWNGTCGYETPGFKKMLEEIMIPLYKQGYASKHFYPEDKPSAINYTLSTTLYDPLSMPDFCCEWRNDEQVLAGFLPMMISSPSRFDDSIFHPVAAPNGTIGQGFIPGKASFLGGSGVAIIANSTQRDLGWAMITLLSNPEFNSMIGLAMGTPPPYHSAREAAVWSSPASIPIQYPQSSFPQFTKLEEMKPFRNLLMDILYRNYTSEELQDRTCKVIDYVMLPACSSRHMEKVVDDCALRNITRRIHYVWSTLSKCRGGIQKLPEPIQIGCSYIPLMAPLNLFMTIFSLFMVGLIIMIMYLLIKYRSRPTIRYSSNTFTLIYLVGCILCCVSVGFKAGDAKFKPCGIDIWILGYGYILVIGTLTLKMWRLVSVVNNTKISRSVKISDQTLINYLLGMVAVQTVILVMWQLFDKPAYITSTKTLLGTDIDYSETVCSIQSNSITLVGVAINLILVLNLVYLVIQGRKIPSKFNDGKLMAIIIYTLTFILTITIATSIFIADTQAQYTLQSSAILLAVFCCSAIYTAPKIYGAIMNRELEGSNSSINMVATSDDKLCIHCGKSQKVLNSVPAARSPSTNKT